MKDTPKYCELVLNNSEEKTKKVSQYHNFQKHLGVTLKKTIKKKKIMVPEPLKNTVEDLFKILMNKNFCTKEFLHAIFGIVKLGRRLDENLMKRFNLMETWEKYGKEKYCESQ